MKTSNQMTHALLANPKDNVATLLGSVRPGDEVVITDTERHTLGRVKLEDAIEMFHKVSVCAIPAGECIVKFGENIGIASQLIPPGAHAHIHNVISGRL